MKKLKIGLITGITIVALSFTACVDNKTLFDTACVGNKTLFDTTYTFNKAIIELPNGEVVEGKVDAWTDFEDGDQFQIVINGKTYLTAATRCVLIKE